MAYLYRKRLLASRTDEHQRGHVGAPHETSDPLQPDLIRHLAPLSNPPPPSRRAAQLWGWGFIGIHRHRVTGGWGGITLRRLITA